jgi:transposase
MPHARTRSGGLDVHQDASAVASVAHAHDAAVLDRGTRGPRPCDLAPRVRTRHSQATPLVCVAAAGPCGSWRSRSLTQNGQGCWGVAPSLMPNQAGDRVHTDRRDAVPRARLRRSGALTRVDGPTVADDARRARTRAHDKARRALKAATCRLNACVRRHELRSTGRATGGPAHRRWLAAVVCATPAPPSVCQESVRTVHEHPARLPRLAHARQEQGKPWRRQPVVEALEGRRGVPCTVAGTIVAARGDRTRVAKPRPGLNSLGLIPAADASGERRRQGALTTAGNAQARRVLVEGAWADRYPAHVRRHGQRRRETLPKPRQDRRWKAHGRRCTRCRRLLARGTPAHQVVVAMARALAGFMGAMAQAVPGSHTHRVLMGPEPSLPAQHASGRRAAPVWCPPRRRGETGRPTRTEMEAGTRRTPVRWSPTHGYPRDQPSCLTGSAAAAGQRTAMGTGDDDITRGQHSLTSEVISTLGIRRGEQPERGTSGATVLFVKGLRL